MKNDKSFRQNFIITFVISMVISLVLAFLGFMLLVYIYRNYGYTYGIIHWLRQLVLNTVGDVNFFLIIFSVIFLIVFFIIFFIMSSDSMKIIDNVSESLRNMAEGNYNEININPAKDINGFAKNANIAGEALKQSRQREILARQAKDTLVINIAHDLRTPLTSIKGYLGLIKDNTNLSDEQKRHYIEIAYSKTLNMEKLIDDLFQFTKLNYSNEELRKSRINLTALVSQLMDEFYPIFSENNLEGRLKADGEAVYLMADGALIARMIENIISNAIRYGATGRYVDVEISKPSDLAIVKIKNYDSFIPEEEVKNIFDNFYRMEHSRNSEKGGSGVGLAIAKNICDMHGGDIKVESSIEHTSFIIELPCLLQ